MTLAGSIAAAAPGAQGFDTDSEVVPVTANALRKAGFEFAVRYLSRGSGQQAGDLSAAEAQAILGAGLALMGVQHCARPGWLPTAELGDSYGQAATTNAAAVGLPTGLTLWLDLEGVATYATAADAIAYCNAWAARVDAAGFISGLYVGAQQPLSADDLYWRLRVKHYWRSASRVPEVSLRGYQLIQAIAPSPVAGLALDRDVTMADGFGGVPIWLAP